MGLELTWRLARLRRLMHGTWLHLRRDGFLPTATMAVQRLHELARAHAQATTKSSAGASRHILILDAVMPDPSRDSGSLRLCNLIRILSGMGWTIDFMPDNLRATAAERQAMDALGARTLCRPQVASAARWLRREGTTLDAAMLCRHYIAAPVVGLVRHHAPSARVLFDTVDLHHLREGRSLAQTHATRRQLRHVERVRRQELALARQCDVTFVVSPIEKQLLEQAVPEARVQLLSNVHDICPDPPGFEDRRDLVFVGGWGHPPNRDAIVWLVESIMPAIRQRLADVQLHMVGDLPDNVRQQLARPDVSIHGRVPDIAPMMRRCRVALAPLRYGAGVKGKINTAMSYGMPVVATTCAAEGMYLADGQDVLLADSPEAFAAQVARVYRDEPLWQAISQAGMENVRQHFSFTCARRCLESVLEPGAAKPTPHPRKVTG